MKSAHLISNYVPASVPRTPTDYRVAVTALAVAFCAPTFVFFVASITDKNNVYLQVSSILVFVWPIVVLAKAGSLDVSLIRTGFILLFFLTAPLWLSIVYHLPAYSFEQLGLAVSRVVALTLYVLTIVLLVGHPRSGSLFSDSLRLTAFFLIAIILFGTFILPDWHYRRFMPAELHPNWWGELSVVVAFGASFFRQRVWRYGCWFGVLTLCIFVESRSALGNILLIAAFSTVAIEGVKRLNMILFIFVFFIVPLCLFFDIFLFDGGVVKGMKDWFVNSVLLLNDPGRGLGSGFTGRDEGWLYAIRIFSEHPWTGLGFSRANAILENDTSHQIHNGHLILLSDLGIIGYTIFFTLFIGSIVRCFQRTDLMTMGFIVGFGFFNMMLNPRAINLSVLAMMFWMTVVLAWLPQLRVAPITQRVPAGSPRGSRLIGNRWRADVRD